MNRNFILQNFPFLEDDFDALTDYQLFCKMIAYMRKVSKQCDDFQKQLNNYENYFKNLDVQEEIDNKLEEMSESGELASIIAQFLNLNVEYVFDTVSDLINATSLLNGSHVKTLGFNTKGDGGASNYYIRTKTESDTTDGYTLIDLTELDDLIAVFEPSNNILNVHQFGIFGDGETDYTDRLNKVLYYNCYFPAGTYLFSDTLFINNHLIYGDGINITKIKLADDSTITGVTPIYAYQKDTINIKNISFDGNSDNNHTTPHTMIALYSCNDIDIENCEVAHTFSGMMTLNDSFNVRISNCVFKDTDGVVGSTGPAIHANPVNNLTIDNCYCEDIADHFLYLTCDDEEKTSKNIIIKNCVLTTCGAEALTAGSALCIYANSSDILIENCILKNNRAGVFIGQHGSFAFTPKNVIINNCMFDGTTLNAIGISGLSTDHVKNIKINNCDMKNITQTGVSTSYCTNLDINNCSIYDSGVGIDTEYTYFGFLNNNKIFDNTTYGILLGRQGHENGNFNISNCMIYGTSNGAQDIGLYLNVVDKVKVYNCDIFNNNEDIRQNIPTNYSYINQVDKSSSDKNLPSLTFADSVPLSGTYRKGDIILFNNGNTSFIGAVCTVAGTPGTWKTFGSVSS